ncbi:MAG TPA: serine/threonine-protein kinase, partial [Kofleriaceae bacterium]
MTSFHKLAREEQLGRYRLIARLGRGGMAEVFLARLVGAGGFEKLVAIKRMLPVLSGDPTFVAMFLREGRIAAQLDHPNICHVYELDDADGTLYLAMEFLRGLPWSEVAPAVPDRPRAILARFVVGAIVQACEGLHHAHTAAGADGQPRSVVHRDVSPSNLFVTYEGIVKLLDFGVSTVLSEATGVGRRKGKLPYMAPEQLRGEAVDVRADLFALAVVTWEALAGRALFDRSSDYDTMMAVHQTAIPALPGDDAATLRLDAVLRRALARDRTQRHGSARELAHDLRQAIAAHGEPMASSEIQAHVATWLAPSLSRRSRDLVELVARRPPPDVATEPMPGDATDEHTAVHSPAPVAGVRLRDASVVVDADVIETEAPTETVGAGRAPTITG